MGTRFKLFLAAYVNLESAWLDSNAHALPFCALGKQLYLLVPYCFSYNVGLILVFLILGHQIHTPQKNLYQLGSNIIPMLQRRKPRLPEASELHRAHMRGCMNLMTHSMGPPRQEGCNIF